MLKKHSFQVSIDCNGPGWKKNKKNYRVYLDRLQFRKCDGRDLSLRLSPVRSGPLSANEPLFADRRSRECTERNYRESCEAIARMDLLPARRNAKPEDSSRRGCSRRGRRQKKNKDKKANSIQRLETYRSKDRQKIPARKVPVCTCSKILSISLPGNFQLPFAIRSRKKPTRSMT